MAENKGVMKSFEFEGWVERVVEDQYSVRVLVRSNKEEEGIKYPQRALFKLTKKLKEEGVDLGNGDNIKVHFFPWVSEGVSKAGKEYCIGELMANKIEVLEKIDQPQDDGDEGGDPDDMPF